MRLCCVRYDDDLARQALRKSAQGAPAVEPEHSLDPRHRLIRPAYSTSVVSFRHIGCVSTTVYDVLDQLGETALDERDKAMSEPRPDTGSGARAWADPGRQARCEGEVQWAR